MTSSIDSPPQSRRTPCPGCHRLQRVCICAALPPAPLATQHRVLVLQTAAESRAAVGTAQLLPLVLRDASVVVARGARALAEALAAAAAAAGGGDADALLLFPGPGAACVSEVCPRQGAAGAAARGDGDGGAGRLLVVLDGSWNGAWRLLGKSDAVGRLRKVRLPEEIVARRPPLFEARLPPANVPGNVFCVLPRLLLLLLFTRCSALCVAL